MNERTGSCSRRGRRGGTLAVLLLLVAGIQQPALTEAAWMDAEYATASLTAGRILPPTGLTCVVDDFVIDGVLQQAVHFTWTAPAEPSLPPERYDIVLTNAGGINPLTGTYSTTGPTTELFIPTSAFLSLGESRATVYSRLGPWTSAPGTPAQTVFATSVLFLGVIVDC